MRQLIIFIIIFASLTFLWWIGPLSLLIPIPSLPQTWHDAFQKPEGLESIYAPIATLFAAFSAGATFFLIYLQQKAMDMQQKNFLTAQEQQYINYKKNIFEKQIWELFAQKTNISKSLKININDLSFKEHEAFIFISSIISYYIELYFKHKINDQYSRDNKFDSFIEKLPKDYLSILDDIEESQQQNISIDTLLKVIEIQNNENFKHILSSYHHTIYVTLKMIYENTDLSEEEKNNYIRIYRSQFSQHEFVVIYFHALIHQDNEGKKFKELIENTCFFHSLDKAMLCIDLSCPSYKDGYSPKAFNHED